MSRWGASVLGSFVLAALVAAPGAGVARAEGPSPGQATASSAAIPGDVMAGLAQHAARFEDMKRRGAFVFSGRLEEVDGDGKASDWRELVVRVTPRPDPNLSALTNVIRYVENGKDKTDEARKKDEERKTKPKKKDRDKDIKLPFLASEQARYVFTMGERDPVHPSRVKVAFFPKEPAEDAIKGSAWVDDADREILSMGFSFSRNPTFIDHVDVTIVFDLATPLGRAPSRVTFDGRGGFLFIRKHFRGVATFSEPRVAF